MSDDAQTELGILGNILILLTIDAGGKIVMPRDRWKEINNVVARRDYDEKLDADVIEIITNQSDEVLM